MGLSFHYSGKFSSKASLPAMIEEVKDIAEAHKWKYHIYETEFPAYYFKKTFDNKTYGICFTPPGCETVSLTFLSNGRLSHTFWLQYLNEDEAYKKYLYMLSVKTQYAGWQLHVLVIRILKYISGKYFKSFSLKDEGMFWETEDESLLKERFKQYAALLNKFSTGLEIIPINPGENLEDYFKRILK
ncbi:MAG: hypothetical protein ABI405_10225 [Parafilimonas sp.]